jgi:hypothetical protein
VTDYSKHDLTATVNREVLKPASQRIRRCCKQSIRNMLTQHGYALRGETPDFGGAARLLSGNESEWSVRKGAIWWFSARERGGSVEVVLTAVISPELL